MTRPEVTVIDYGMGNLLSVCRALEHCGAQVDLSGDAQALANAPRLVLPGVGAFGDGMRELRERGLTDAVRAAAAQGRPLLGICLGAQMLLERSEEYGDHAGLGLIPGQVLAVPAAGADGRPHKIPHMGWAPIQPAEQTPQWRHPLLHGIEPGTACYFVHSFQIQTEPGYLLALADYDGIPITAAVAHGAILGCQFHPEKSGPAGLRILQNFLALEAP